MSDVRRRCAILFFGAALCLCVVARLFAQQSGEAAAQGGGYTIKVGVNSVLVPVVVRDAHGRVVGDLTQKDFALFASHLTLLKELILSNNHFKE